jgi:glycosyltransferase involved in cell wall biosynthesis
MDARWLPDRRGGPVVSLVLPTYNPGPAIERTCRAVDRFLRQTSEEWEVLFVCDGCTDGTPERLKALTSGTPGVRVMSHDPNRGKGYAVRRGLEAARGRWRIFTDVDLAYSLDEVRRLAAVLRGGAAVAIASRWHPESRLVVPARLQGYAYRRQLQSLAFSWLVRLLLPLTHRDTQAGLKGLSADAARRILPVLRSRGFEFDCELLTACMHHGLVVAELPVCVRIEDTASTTTWRTMARMVRELWNIRRTWRKGVPAPEPVADRRQPRAA